MIKILIRERCHQCGGPLRSNARIHEEDKHNTEDGYAAGVLTTYWHHPGWWDETSLPLICPHCGTLHTLHIGMIEMHCHPEVKTTLSGQRNAQPKQRNPFYTRPPARSGRPRSHHHFAHRRNGRGH